MTISELKERLDEYPEDLVVELSIRTDDEDRPVICAEATDIACYFYGDGTHTLVIEG